MKHFPTRHAVVNTLGIFVMAAAACMTGGKAAAQQFNLTLNTKTSSVSSDSSLSVAVPGTIIGNYDAASNPGGTQTRPGLFGGSGNQPINTDLTLGGDGNFTAHPAGSVQLDIDLTTGQVAMSGLTIDVLNGTPAGLDLSLGLLYDSFHTVAPVAIFPGGIQLTLPLGSIELQALTIAQTDSSSVGALVPAGKNQYTFAVASSGVLNASVDVLGQVTPITDVPVPLALAGTITIQGGIATIELSLAQTVKQTIPGPFPGGTIADQPFDVPTVLPPGNTAHLLFNGEVESIAVSLALSGTLIASGPGFAIGDIDHNGFVNVDDLLNLINHWGACKPGLCDADINHDGIVEQADLDLLLAHWS